MTSTSTRRPPPRRLERGAKRSDILYDCVEVIHEWLAHRHNGLVRIHQLVPQLDEHLERELRFFRCGHDLVQLDRFAADEALDVVLRYVLLCGGFTERALERVAERRAAGRRLLGARKPAFAGDVETNAARALAADWSAEPADRRGHLNP